MVISSENNFRNRPTKKHQQKKKPNHLYLDEESRMIIMKNEEDRSKDTPIANYIDIAAILKNIDTNQFRLLLEFDYKGTTYQREITRKMLTKLKILELQEFGADVNEENVHNVLIFLNRREEHAPLKLIHSHVGLGEYEKNLIYKHHRAIGVDSGYSGDLLIEPKGTYEEWYELIQHQVIGHTPLELALVAGLSAPLASLITKETGIEVIVMHIYGNSTQGKTTATRLAVSPFGYPHTREGGLVKTWNGTANAIINHFKNVHGLPMALDEASMRNGDFTKFIYILAGGRDKARLNKESEMKETAEWSGVIISNAEHSLHDKSVKNAGAQTRLIEIGNVVWTKNAENAEALKEGLLKNYGQAGPKFVKYILDLGNEALISLWQEWRQTIISRMERPDSFADRLSERYAVIMATAKLAKDYFEFNLNLENILQLLLNVINNTGHHRDLAESAYDHFFECYTQHSRKFVTDQPDGVHELWGKYVRYNKKPHQVYVLTHVFNDIMKNGGFENTNVILQLWKDRGLLEPGSDRLSVKKTLLPGTRPRVYVINVRDDHGELQDGKIVKRHQAHKAHKKDTDMDLANIFETN